MMKKLFCTVRVKNVPPPLRFFGSISPMTENIKIKFYTFVVFFTYLHTTQTRSASPCQFLWRAFLLHLLIKCTNSLDDCAYCGI